MRGMRSSYRAGRSRASRRLNRQGALTRPATDLRRSLSRMAGFCVRHVGDSRLCFVLGAPTKQNGGETKPFWRFAKATRNASWLTPRAIENDRPNRPLQGTVMIKALSAVAVAGFLAAGLSVLPGFAPKVEASTPQPLAKADRLDVRPIGRD